ncbi:ABC-F family ATP-binding cassette domain-containing protein [Iamia sp. SCSIO 61187]|uniref:ABC-F family ATP-binding cassette domain-containing protein n=1 Tax=Iamia sp. SCSIO 61187 TaxID=2722752 RepID=UPI001C62F64C|nr:ABC-F family ATP-binding cassette domain-containing protein [Iamia sp. SCSIO 61187]QYG92000.1 ABC-F family ATP-binding cassette domain-containing protein [Iamia sp. SCSIO 61187]
MPSPTPALTIAARGISLDRGATTVLADVDLSASSGDRLGLVGPNGVGKSTLLGVLAGTVAPDRGTVTVTPPSAIVALLAQEPARTGESGRDRIARRTGVAAAQAALDAATAALAAGTPGADDRYSVALDRWLHVGAADVDARLGTIAADLGLPDRVLDQATDALSGGQAARIELAAVLLTQADVLLLDEPTNDLDFDGLARLEDRVRSHVGALVVVSHDRAFLERTVTGVVELDEHTRTARTFSGGWLAYLDERATARRHAEEAYATYDRTRSELRAQSQQIREWSAQGVAKVKRSGETDKFIKHHNTQTSEKMAGKAARADRALERLEVVDKPFEGWELRLELATAERSGAVVSRLTGAVVERGPFRLGPVDVEVRSGDRLVVSGPNGAGKTTLVEALLGRAALAAGEGWVGPSVRVGELEQLRTRFTSSDPTRHPGRAGSAGTGSPDAGSLLDAVLAETGWTLAEARSLLAKFGLTADHVARPATSLSPGERTRASLALLMAVGTNWLVLDEPTNHLDLPAIEQLEQALGTWSGTLLVVSHDRRFLDAVTTEGTRHLHVDGGRVSEGRA